MKAWTVGKSEPAIRLAGKPAMAPGERLAASTFYRLRYAPHPDHGRFAAEMLIAVDCPEYAMSPRAWIRQAALTIGGHPMHFLLGTRPAPAWDLRAVTQETWAARGTGEALFLSDGPLVEGWPEPAPLEAIQSGAALFAKIANWRGLGCDGADPAPSDEQRAEARRQVMQTAAIDA
jgi:hypothetical protein